MQMYDNIRTKEVEFPRDIDVELQDLILSLLRKDPERRPTIEEIKRHPWTQRGQTKPI